MRIALYGGAFDPPHLAHVFTLTWLLQRRDVDAVWLLPAAAHAFAKRMTPFADRVAMLELVVAALGSDRIEVCRIEQELEGSGRTFDTLAALQARHPDHTLRLVLGADNLTESHRWHRFDELVTRWSVLALGRPGHEGTLARFAKEPWCEPGPTLPGISSTRLRAALRGGGDPEALGWLPDACRPLAEQLYPRTRGAGRRLRIFGAGRAGRTFAAALSGAGHTVLSVWNRSPRAEATASGSLPADLSADVWILAVSDPALPALAARLAVHADAPGVALHCAGRLDAEAIGALRARGTAVGSLHPLQSLGDDPGALRGAWCAIEGDAAARRVARALAQAVGGLPVELPRGEKAAYHAAAVFAANFSTVLAAGGVELLRGLQIDGHDARAMLLPLLRGTLGRLATAPAEQALTGPFARADLEAIGAHVLALARHAPRWSEAYAALARATAGWLGWDRSTRAGLEAQLTRSTSASSSKSTQTD